ncbi:MAG TPA: hypothetical protein VJ927_07840 [Actinomycetota bacterium]|nr:hypothetical protein [Actinomycetota bacterium]
MAHRSGGSTGLDPATQQAFQEALLRIPQVQSAQIRGSAAGGPREIHVVTTSERTPKQTVRDVQSLAAAAFGVKIDHRIVSVVQIEESHLEQQMSNRRAYIERVGLGTKGNAEWVEVALRWPDGGHTEGSGAAGKSRSARARGAAAATLECLDRKLSTKKATVEIENIVLHRMGSEEWVLVHCAFYEAEGQTSLLGSALIHDDVATAASRALLNAVNRKLRVE